LKKEAGIARINKEYIHSISKPNFDLSENRIKIILQITEIDQLNWEIKS
jgi:ATP-dependent DNA helicase RecG